MHWLSWEALCEPNFLYVSVLRVASGPRVKLASCKSALNPPVVYSTDRSKAVVPVLVLLFVALWFILRGDLLYVFPCVIMFLCFLVLLVLRLPRLGVGWGEAICCMSFRVSFCSCVFQSFWCCGCLAWGGGGRGGRGGGARVGGRTSLGAFRTFVRFVLVWICRFPLPLGVWEGLRFVIVALPWLFSCLFFVYIF